MAGLVGTGPFGHPGLPASGPVLTCVSFSNHVTCQSAGTCGGWVVTVSSVCEGSPLDADAVNTTLVGKDGAGPLAGATADPKPTNGPVAPPPWTCAHTHMGCVAGTVAVRPFAAVGLIVTCEAPAGGVLAHTAPGAAEALATTTAV
jgi:hypothetical protein